MSMNLTDLEKLEALHADATPGEWGLSRWRREDTFGNATRFYGDLIAGSGDQVIWSSEDGGVAPKDGDAEAVIALHNAFPAMAKALREAWARCETLAAIADSRSYESGLYARRMGDAQEARRSSRAEVERLRGAIARFVSQYPWQDGPEIQELKALKGEGL